MGNPTLLQRMMNEFHSGNSTEKLILAALVSHADQDGSNVFIGKKKIAKYANTSESTVKRSLRRLRSSGVITPHESDRRDSMIPANRRPTAYRINADKFGDYALWYQANTDFNTHSRGVISEPAEANLDVGTEPPGGSDNDPSRGVTGLTPNQSLIPNTTSSSSGYISSEGDEEGRDGGEGITTTFTEESSAENEKLEESDTQTDSHSFTASPPAVAESISVAAPPDRQQATNPPVEESSPRDTRGSQNDTQSFEGIRNPDPRPIEWRPHPEALELAKAKAPAVNPELVITRYWLWCLEKKRTPSSGDWLVWMTRDQERYEKETAEAERQTVAEQRESKPWYEKELRF